MTATPQRYIVYRTVASGAEGIGYVVNAVIWDGTTAFPLDAGFAIVADAASEYEIGATIVVAT